MTDIKIVPDDMRDRWRHDLNCSAYRLSGVRNALGVIGVMNPQGSLEGLIIDMERARIMLKGIQDEAAAAIRKSRDGK